MDNAWFADWVFYLCSCRVANCACNPAPSYLLLCPEYQLSRAGRDHDVGFHGNRFFAGHFHNLFVGSTWSAEPFFAKLSIIASWP